MYPELTWEVSNWQPEHRACSDASGQESVIRKAKADALRAAGITDSAAIARVLDSTSSQVSPFFPAGSGPGKPPPLPVSLSNAGDVDDPTANIRPALTWAGFVAVAPAWCVDLLEIPEDSAPPLAMTPPHPAAVGTYGWDVIKEVEAHNRRPLRWWQKLALVRLLEHDRAGALVWKYHIASGPRRIGKSHVYRGGMYWRLGKGRDLFDEPQVIVHTAMDLYVCRKVQRPAWPWAAAAGWKVVKANGKEAIERPDPSGSEDAVGDVWSIRSAASAGHSDDVTFAFVDEAWDVEPIFVDDGLVPAMTDRNSAQLVLTSTANRRATSLMRTQIATALEVDDEETLLMLWAAPAGADIGDPAVWRASSPHWTADRAKTMAKMYRKALAGESDPELDDPDPIEGFKSQWLNMWKLRERKETKGEPLISPAEWAALEVPAPTRVPDAVAVESWPGASVTVARAWKMHDTGLVLVSATEHPTLAIAWRAARAGGYRRKIHVGKSHIGDPSVRMPYEPHTGRGAQAAADLADLLRDSRLCHDGSPWLTEQVLAARTTTTPDGVRLVSTERADGLKAAVWAAEAAAAMPARAVGRFITATTQI
ncbi:MAG TPA: HNH endonuclease [Nocardioides sp.]